MLKDKKIHTVITFPNTTSALAMEKACHSADIPGRIIPVPDQITAGCGFAWCAEDRDRARIEAFIREENLIHDHIYSIEI